ncbi:hypothetical protein D3C87_760160 [compost metagenome]
MRKEVKVKKQEQEKALYLSPRIEVQHIELEYSVAAGSTVENGMTESWETNSQGKELEW